MDQEKSLSSNIERFNNIMNRYRNGEFGNQHMVLAEILEAANETNLLDQMSISEIQYLSDNSFGIIKMLFSEWLQRKKKDDEQIQSSQLTLAKKDKSSIIHQ